VRYEEFSRGPNTQTGSRFGPSEYVKNNSVVREDKNSQTENKEQTVRSSSDFKVNLPYILFPKKIHYLFQKTCENLIENDSNRERNGR
jgi:hypothetical protein